MAIIGAAIELATAYVSVVPSTRNFGRLLVRSISAEVAASSAASQQAGAGAAAQVLAGAKKTLKIGALGAAFAGAVAIKGGLSRALQIEEAEARLKGLGHTNSSVAKIMESANESVLGTAYRLDEAATVSATAVAAGVKPGKELTKYLKMVADASYEGGTNLGEMGDIINKVTARGRVYTRDLNQLAQRGIPIYQWLREELGVTRLELEQMVRAGKIDSEIYRRVIQKNIGGAAMESGKTTRGAFRNLGAAMARTGAWLVQGILPVFRQGFVGLTHMIDGLKEPAQRVGKAIGDMMQGVIDWLKQSEGFQRTVENIKAIIKGIWQELEDWAQAIKDNKSDLGWLATFLEDAWGFSADLLDVIKDHVEWIPRLTAAYTAWRTATALLNAVMSMNPILLAIGVIGLLATALYSAYKNNKKFRKQVDKAWNKIKSTIEDAWEKIKPKLEDFKKKVEDLKDEWNDLKKSVKKAWDNTKNEVEKTWNRIKPTLDDMKDAIEKDLIPSVKRAGKELGKAFGELSKAAGPALEIYWKFILKPLLTAIGWFMLHVLVPIIGAGVEGIAKKFGFLASVFSVGFDNLAGTIEWVRKNVIEKIGEWWPTFKSQLTAGFEMIGTSLANAWRMVGQPVVDWIKEQFGKLVGKIDRVMFGVTDAVKRAWGALGKALDWVWQNIIKAAFDKVRGGAGRVRDAFDSVKRFVGRVWRALGDGISWVWENVIKRAFDKLRGGLARVRNAFTAARGFIGRVWGGIVNAIKNPIKAAMGIINRFLIKPINSIARGLGIRKGKASLIGEINTEGWAGGGYTGRMNPRRVAGVVHGDEHVIQARSRRALERRNPGALDWMNRTGQWPGYARGGRVMPLRGATFSTYPGHTGVDLNAPNDMGKPVLSAAPGRVARVVRRRDSYGLHVWVRMANGLSAIYAHLSRVTVKAGQLLAAGQQLGNVGSTGNSTGPHLHFEIRPQGTYGASVAFLRGATHLAGGVSAEEDGSNFISRIINARKNLKEKLKGIGGGVGELIRGAAGKVANGAVDWVKDRVESMFGGGIIGWGVNKLKGLFSDKDGPAKSRSVQAAKGAAFNALKSLGWGHAQWGPLDRLWMKESGWRWNARNPSSGAYGIPQALPASKMASAGADWRTNPLTQIKWGLRYIKQRYGSPAKAWAHSQRTGWYDEGGWLEPYGVGGRGGRRRGKNVAVNRSRKPEPILTAAQWALLKRFLPITKGQQGIPPWYPRGTVTNLAQVERIVARVARKYGDTSRKAQRARRIALDARFNLTGKQWKQLRKALPAYTKRAGRPDSLRDMQKALARVRERYGRRSPEYRRTRQLTYEARFGGQYTKATWNAIKKYLPQTGKYATAANAAKQIQSLVLKTFGPSSPITRRVTKLAKKITTATQRITNYNNALKSAQEAQKELRTNLTEKFQADAFGNGLENLRLTLQANVNDARAFGAALKTATSKGLSGGLLKALAASGDVQTAKEIANLSRAQIQVLENQWAQREKVTAQIGAQAASLAYGPDIRALRASIAQQNRVLRSLRADLRDATYRGTKAGIQGTTRKTKAKKKTKGKK